MSRTSSSPVVGPARFLRWVEVLSFILLGVYLWFFWRSVSPFWFHPDWTTDDALQQWFPLLRVHHPTLFEGDIIYEVMRGYLPPLHWLLAYVATVFTGDTLMAAHWIMLLQIVLTLVGIVLTMRALCSPHWIVPSCTAVGWFIHSRGVVQRMTGGLPRGWAPVVIVAFFAAACACRWRMVLVVLGLGCLLHPPSTLILALAYGMYLFVGLLNPQKRDSLRRPFVELLAVSPLFLLMVIAVIQRPEEIGQMVNLQEASSMPEFLKPHGRFPFLPFISVYEELKLYGFEAFVSRFRAPFVPFLRSSIVEIGALLVLGLGLISWRTRSSSKAVPAIFWYYLLSLMAVYLLSRQIAFKLYVPNRHLQFPLLFFFVLAGTAAVWRLGASAEQPLRHVTARLCGLMALALFVVLGSREGLAGTLNFNYPKLKRGRVFEWVRHNTPEQSFIAGEPTHIDPLQLFGERRGLVTSETAHPFYAKFNEEMRRRLAVSFRAHYARNAEEFLSVLEPENVDYFIFARARFYPNALKAATYYEPHAALVRELTSRAPEDYFYRSLSESKAPWIVFRDKSSLVVDVRLLRTLAHDGLELPTTASQSEPETPESPEVLDEAGPRDL